MKIELTDLSDVADSANRAELAGLDSVTVYNDQIKRTEEEIQKLINHKSGLVELRDHVHEWNDNDYCSICGADGRA
jgi:hypothetical protein